jgi:alanyl-tRNA synthetase
VGDSGIITGPDNLRIRITDTQKKLGELFVHLGTVEAGTARVGGAVVARVDHERRGAIRAHHSATHLLHEALRRHLGTHVTQKGSLNAPDRLRFDISQPRPVTAEELALVEREVNARIRENAEVTTRLMTPDEAVKLGAMALFGEKYGDEVRVVAMGAPEEGTEKSAYSIELCGGTHVTRTGDIGLFRIVSEGAVSAGVRRIEALAGAAAIAAIEDANRLLAEAAAVLKAPPAELPARITQLQDDKKRLERQLSDLQKKLVLSTATEFEMVGGLKLIARHVGEIPAKELRPIATDLLKGLGSGVVALVSSADQKSAIAVAVSDDVSAAHGAVDLVRAAAAAVGGSGGGGNKTMAQAGGPDGGKWEAALAAIRSTITA